jgi:hypothetical protein
MRKIIHTIRQKPAPVRRFVATSSALVITLVIAFVWLGTFSTTKEKVVKNEKSPNPFSLLASSFSKLFSSGNAGGQASVYSAFSRETEGDTTAITLTPATATVEIE